MDSTAANRNCAFRSARLTPELVARIARKLEDRGPAPGVVVHNEDRITQDKQADGCRNGTVNRTLALVRAILRKCAREWEWFSGAPT